MSQSQAITISFIGGVLSYRVGNGDYNPMFGTGEPGNSSDGPSYFYYRLEAVPSGYKLNHVGNSLQIWADFFPDDMQTVDYLWSVHASGLNEGTLIGPDDELFTGRIALTVFHFPV